MNRLKLLVSTFVLFSIFSLVSCDNEPVDPAIDLSAFNDDGNGNGNGNGNGGNQSGDYWPTALNNQWIYKRDGVLQSPSKIVSINAINGNTYFTFDTFISQGGSATVNPTTRVRKNAGDYYYKLDDFNISLGGGINGVQTGFEFILLKDYLPVGQSWSGSYTQTTTYDIPLIPPISQDVSYVGTILAKDVTVTVNGQTYNNVIKMRLFQEYDYDPSSGVPDQVVNNEYWFAKNIGIVKIVNITSQSTSTVELVSYVLN